jgi:predicted hotdog family 3-hydroxylacyl-ACP dehydratase
VTSGTASQAYTLVVTGITPTTLPNATVGTAYSSGTMTVLTAATWSISTGTLPPGLVLTASSTTTDTITGTPTTAGTFTFTVKSGTAAQSYTVIVTGLSPTTLPSATAGATYSSGTLTSPIAGTWSVSVGVLPVGLVLNASVTTTDTITGTPTTAGTYSFTIKSGTVTQSYSLVVLPPIVVFHATRVIGHVTAGKTVIITIAGAGFYGRPTVVSHAGTVAIVTHDNGKLLTVRVAVARGSRNGIFTFTIRLANGHTTRVRYNQHA